MRYYLSSNGQTNGPHDEGQIKQWHRAGQIQPGTMLATEANPGDWLPFERSALALASKGSRTGALVIGGVVLFALFICGLSLKGGGNKSGSKVAATTEPTPKAAEPAVASPPSADRSRCLLSTGDSSTKVPVFPTEDGMSEFGAAAARDEGNQALAVILASNGGFLAEPGTKCSYTDVGIIRSEVRVIEGPHMGRKGWVPAEWARGGR